VGTLGMIIPASGGIGAYNLAMKLVLWLYLFQWGKVLNLEVKWGLPILLFLCRLQILIMLGDGLISIPMLAKARNNIVAEKEFRIIYLLIKSFENIKSGHNDWIFSA
jgi:hypothetical protein